MVGDPTHEQPRAIHDLVWEALIAEQPGGPYRTVGEMLIAGLAPEEITHIIDVTVTTLRQQTEG